MVPLKVTFVAALLLASIVDQVYSRECYVCEYDSLSGKGEDCKDNPAQSKYASTCTSTKEAGVAGLTFTAKAADYKCVVLQAHLGHTILSRGCIPSYLDCEKIKGALPTVKLEKCSICDSDLCNASSKVGITIFTLIFCLSSYLIFH